MADQHIWHLDLPAPYGARSYVDYFRTDQGDEYAWVLGPFDAAIRLTDDMTHILLDAALLDSEGWVPGHFIWVHADHSVTFLQIRPWFNKRKFTAGELSKIDGGFHA